MFVQLRFYTATPKPHTFAYVNAEITLDLNLQDQSLPFALICQILLGQARGATRTVSDFRGPMQLQQSFAMTVSAGLRTMSRTLFPGHQGLEFLLLDICLFSVASATL